ncbi:MAG: DUF1573 domain-containing protein [Planctomycetales bacterium]|nr:DUF1573 domain-containing protein [Planctomycetales bacterium]
MNHCRFFFRFLALAMVLSPLADRPLHGQEWIKSMFEETTHDYGTVPRGAKAEYAFKLVNKFQENVHIASVRSSCGCTIPRIEKAELKTYEEGAIVCEFNTRSFIGGKSAVVTVVFDRPYYGEMQLMVKGNIRSDIVTEPGEIQFGEIDQGTEKATSVQITHAGNSQWRISDVRSANHHLGVTLEPTIAQGGRVEYQMRVRIRGTAPIGEFSDQIVLVTNDQQYNLVTIPVRGSVLPPLVMPVSVELGTVKQGELVRQRMLIKSNQEFAVTKVTCEDGRFSFTPTLEKKGKVHIIPLEFTSDNVGAFREKVEVHTTLLEDNIATTMVSGNVVP